MRFSELFNCPAEHVNRELLPGVIPCAVFSPPYNCNIDYDGYDDFLDWPVYKEMASASCSALWDVMSPGGRVWCNVQATVPAVPPFKNGAGKKQTFEERVNLAWIWENALRNAGFAYRDTVVWIQDSHDGGTAWGSYRKPSAPNLRGGHELILNFYKPPYKRETPPKWKGWEDPFGKDDWPELTRNVWKIPPSRNKEHAATFPVELATRCIRLSTWPGETVLDPFAGSGTTGVAALQYGRRFVGFDLSPASIKIAEARLEGEEAQAKEAPALEGED